MTGEITLRGEVLPIGGLKEKLLAAHRGGITTVLIPSENEKDLAEIPDNIKDKLEIKPVKWIDEVLDYALERSPLPGGRRRATPTARRRPRPRRRRACRRGEGQGTARARALTSRAVRRAPGGRMDLGARRGHDRPLAPHRLQGTYSDGDSAAGGA